LNHEGRQAIGEGKDFETTVNRGPRALLAVLDAGAVILTAILAYVFLFGGFVVSVYGVAIRFRAPARTFLWLLAVLVLRRLLFGRAPAGSLLSRALSRAFATDTGAASLAKTRSWRHAVLAGVGLTVAIAIVFVDVVRHLDSVHDYGDPLFSMWRLGWVSHQLATDPAHLFDANIFYPERVTLTLSDPSILPGLIQTPLTALGVPPVLAYNLLFLLAVWLSGIATYVFVERLTASSAAAFIAAVIFSCYPYRLEHISYFEGQMTMWMPLALLALHLFIRTGRWPYAWTLAAAMIGQIYSSMYYAVFLAVYAAVVGVGLVWIHRPSIRRIIVPAAAAALVTCLVAAPLFQAFAAAQPMKGERRIEEVKPYSAEIGDYFSGQKFNRWWADPAPKAERALFPGVAPLALALVGLAPPFTTLRLVYAVSLLLTFDASRGFNGVIYPYLYRWVPPFRGMRVASRFSILVGFTLSIFAAFGVQRLLRRCPSTVAKTVVLAAVYGFIVVESLSKLDTMVPVWREPPSIYEQIRNTPSVVLAELPIGPESWNSAVFQYFSLWHWAPMVGGYSSFLPPSYGPVRQALAEFPRGSTVNELRSRGVTHVTLNCGLPHASKPDCEETARLIAASPDVRLVAETRWSGEPVRLYTWAR
jgi:hypothetical protein